MSKVFIISDLHLGHKSMALHRGFSSVEEHDETIVRNWNNVVGKRDLVKILGDITMEKATHYPMLDLLNGRKQVVGGNHDKATHMRELLKYVDSVVGMERYKGCFLTHCPIHPSELERVKYNLHGHVHEKSLPDSRYINTSCEALGYIPIEFKKLISDRDFVRNVKNSLEM